MLRLFSVGKDRRVFEYDMYNSEYGTLKPLKLFLIYCSLLLKIFKEFFFKFFCKNPQKVVLIMINYFFEVLVVD